MAAEQAAARLTQSSWVAGAIHCVFLYHNGSQQSNATDADLNGHVEIEYEGIDMDSQTEN